MKKINKSAAVACSCCKRCNYNGECDKHGRKNRSFRAKRIKNALF